jgi:hypothetical protein
MIKNIFSVPIYTSLVSKEISNEIENLVVSRLHLLKKNKEQSTDFYNESKTVLPHEIINLTNEINIQCLNYAKLTNSIIGSKINYWVQDYSPNDFHRPHVHQASLLSGVYYVRANEQAGYLRFTTPNPYTWISLYDVPYEEKMYFNVKPQKGLIILFPSYLIHQVVPSDNNNVERTCIAFNLDK